MLVGNTFTCIMFLTKRKHSSNQINRNYTCRIFNNKTCEYRKTSNFPPKSIFTDPKKILYTHTFDVVDFVELKKLLDNVF